MPLCEKRRFTYSGIDNEKIEPYPSRVAADSLKLMSAPARRRYHTVLYRHPLVILKDEIAW